MTPTSFEIATTSVTETVVYFETSPPETITVVSTDTFTSTSLVTSTVVNPDAVVTANYAKKTQVTNSNCGPNNLGYRGDDVSSDSTNNWETGIRQCALRCDGDPNCQSFVFYASTQANAYRCISYSGTNAGLTCNYGFSINLAAAYDQHLT